MGSSRVEIIEISLLPLLSPLEDKLQRFRRDQAAGAGAGARAAAGAKAGCLGTLILLNYTNEQPSTISETRLAASCS